MSLETKIGKIKSIKFGKGGYDDAMIGLTIHLGSDKGSWGVGDFKGTWANDRTKDTKWTDAQRDKTFADVVHLVNKLLSEAKVDTIDKLVGKPVEVTFENRMLKSWRILTEVI